MNTKQKSITLQPRHLIISLLAFIVLAVVGFALVWPALVRAAEPTTAELAAREGAQAFLSIDHKAGRPAWERNLCRVSTEELCAIYKGSLGDMVWGPVSRNSMQQRCWAVDATRKPSLESDKESQAWLVEMECDITGLGTGKSEIVSFVIQDEDAWKLYWVASAKEVRDVD